MLPRSSCQLLEEVSSPSLPVPLSPAALGAPGLGWHGHTDAALCLPCDAVLPPSSSSWSVRSSEKLGPRRGRDLEAWSSSGLQPSSAGRWTEGTVRSWLSSSSLLCWRNTRGTYGLGPMAINSGSHTDPSPAVRDVLVLRLHQRLPLGDESGEDFGALKLAWSRNATVRTWPSVWWQQGRLEQRWGETAQEQELGVTK